MDNRYRKEEKMLTHKDTLHQNKPIPIFSWALYDFANTIFSILVITRYLPPMLKDLTGESSPMGAAAAFSMILAGVMVPILGAISDRTGRNKRYLFVAMLLCVSCTSMISMTKNVPAILGLFFIANMAYQVSMVFYNSLLPSVCTQERIGTVSGFGVALGYAGSLLALISANYFVKVYGVQGVFLFAGVLFFIFSLPVVFWVRERRMEKHVPINRDLIHERVHDLVQTLRSLPAHLPVLYFLLGNFFCLDAVNTTIIFFSEFLQNARGFSGAEITRCLLVIQISALIFSVLIGRGSDTFGPKVMILWVVSVWILVVGTILITRTYWVIFAVSVLGGFGLGGIWVAGRAWLLELAPPGQVGKFMGLYGMTGKFSAIGALFFGLLADFYSYDTALAFQLVMLLLGGIFFALVRTKDGTSYQSG